MWNLSAICDACAAGLLGESARRDLEQSPYGLDAMDELEIHELLSETLQRAGYGAHREQRYPADRAGLRRSRGDRCDIVLTRHPDDHLLDPLASGTLFGHLGATPDEALWIEVKTAHQFALIDGALDAGRAYSAQLLSAAIADIRKLARDPAIEHAAILLVMFNADEPTSKRDLDVWLNRCLDLNLPVSAPSVARFPIADRLGNAACTVALTPVHPTWD